jgi:hypothetical protein
MQNMASFCDITVPLLGALVAALLVLRWGWLGFVGGFFVLWGFFWLRLELLYYFDPERDVGVLDAVVIGIVSPALSFLWCLAALLVRYLYRRLCMRRGHHA